MLDSKTRGRAWTLLTARIYQTFENSNAVGGCEMFRSDEATINVLGSVYVHDSLNIL